MSMHDREPARIFVSYAEADRAFFEAFEKHLSGVRRSGLVELRSAGQIQAGAARANETRAEIERAEVIVLLISPDFLASDRIWEEQLTPALDRHVREQSRVIPVWIRAVLSHYTPIAEIQGIPRNGDPIRSPKNHAVWKEVAEEILRVLTLATVDDRDGPQNGRYRQARMDGPTSRRGLLDEVEDILRMREERDRRKLEIWRRPLPSPVSAYSVVRVRDEYGQMLTHALGAFQGEPTSDLITLFEARAHRVCRVNNAFSVLVYDHDGAPASSELRSDAHARGIHLVRLFDFRNLLDLDPYVANLQKDLDSHPLYPPSLYIPQRGVELIGDRPKAEIDDVLAKTTELLESFDGHFLLVLGDFGTGKTFLLRELARRLIARGRPPYPVLLSMRSLEKAHKLDALVATHFAELGLATRPKAFRFMLREGLIALLVDGFDELALRVRYERADEHFDTLVEAAQGKAKVVLTSRTQHFESDKQVRTALGKRAAELSGYGLLRVEPFSEGQIRQYLVHRLGDESGADARVMLLRSVRDLMGLSANPRMLSFIAELPPEDLEKARNPSSGTITAASLYGRLLDRWFEEERSRVELRGAAESLKTEDRWQAVRALARKLWASTESAIRVRDLPDEMGAALTTLTARNLDKHEAAHQVGSATLLVRDAEGNFSFLHQSVMEWIVARCAADELIEGRAPAILTERRMSPLMAEFLAGLSGREAAIQWGRGVLESDTGSDVAKDNALLLLRRLGEKAWRARLAGQDLKGRDLSGMDFRDTDMEGADLSSALLRGADLARANLAKAKLVKADLENASLQNADLQGADLSFARMKSANLTEANLAGAVARHADLQSANLAKADLRKADLSFARLTRADLCGAKLEGAVLRVAKLLGAHLDEQGLTGLEMVGSAPALPTDVQPTTLSSLGSCHSVAWSPDGLLVVAGYSSGALVLWEAATGAPIRAWSAHEAEVRCVAWSLDGRTLASGSDDKSVRMWRVSDGVFVLCLQGHTSSVSSVAFSPDGLTLASGARDSSVRLWRVSDGASLLCLQEHRSSVYSVAFSPYGLTLASGSSDGSIELWSLKDGASLISLRGYGVSCIAWSPDGLRLASGSDDYSVRLWRVHDGAILLSLQGHTDSVSSVAFSPDGLTLASGARDSSVRLWRVPDGAALLSLQGHTDSVSSVAFSPGGLTLASGARDSSVRLWRVPDGAALLSLQGHTDSVSSVAFSPDGLTLASGSFDNSIRLWRVPDGASLLSLQGHTHYVSNVAFSPDGLTLASGSWDKSVRLWRVPDGASLLSLQGHEATVSSVAFSPDGRTLASGSFDNTIRLWRVPDGASLLSLQGHTHYVSSVAFSPDGLTLASGSLDNTIRLWRVSDGRCLAILYALPTGWVAFTPEGRYRLSGDLQGSFWHVINLCRFEPGELDEHFPDLRLKDGEPLFTL